MDNLNFFENKENFRQKKNNPLLRKTTKSRRRKFHYFLEHTFFIVVFLVGTSEIRSFNGRCLQNITKAIWHIYWHIFKLRCDIFNFRN